MITKTIRPETQTVTTDFAKKDSVREASLKITELNEQGYEIISVEKVDEHQFVTTLKHTGA